MLFPAGDTFHDVSPNLWVADKVAVEVEGRVQQLQDVRCDLKDLESQVEGVLLIVHDSRNCLERGGSYFLMK